MSDKDKSPQRPSSPPSRPTVPSRPTMPERSQEKSIPRIPPNPVKR